MNNISTVKKENKVMLNEMREKFENLKANLKEADDGERKRIREDLEFMRAELLAVTKAEEGKEWYREARESLAEFTDDLANSIKSLGSRIENATLTK